MNTISVTDDSLKSGFTLNHFLAIKFSPVNVICAILDVASNTFVAFESRNFCDAKNFSEEMKKLVLLKMMSEKDMGKFGKVIVLVCNPVFSIVPDELFIKEEEKKYLSLTHTFQVNEKAENDHMVKINSHNVYWLPFDIKEYVDRHFLLHEYRHFSSVFLNDCLLNNKHQDAVYVYVCNNLLYVVAIREKKLVLCNAYEYFAGEDLVYHTMNVLQKLDFDLRSVPLFISGENENLNEFRSMISGYIRNVIFFVRPSEYNYIKGITELPPYYNSVLFSTFLCA